MANFIGALCIGKDGRQYIASYTYHHDLYTKVGPLENPIDPIAHISYTKKERKEGAVDYFPLPPRVNPRDLINVIKTIRILDDNRALITTNHLKKLKTIKEKSIGLFDDGEANTTIDIQQRPMRIVNNLETCDHLYDIVEERIEELDPRTIEDLYVFSRADIKDHCGNNVAETYRENKLRIVKKIEPLTRMEKTSNKKGILRGGKKQKTPECGLEANLDFLEWCPTQFIPESGAYFDGKNFFNFFHMLHGECNYCYMEGFHGAPAKTNKEINQQRLKEELLEGKILLRGDKPIRLGRPIKILRFGKNSESYTQYTRDDFMMSLETCAQTGTRGVIPTKFLPFNEEIYQLCKRTRSIPLHSVNGNIKIAALESGARRLGSTVNWRLEQALKYQERGLNNAIYLSIIAHLPPTRGDIEILNIADYGRKLRIQLLPLRMKPNLVHLLTGETFKHLKGDKNQPKMSFVDSDQSSTHIQEGNRLLARKIHPFWENLIQQNNGNIRMCHHNDEKAYCGLCFQGQGFICERNHN